MQKLQNWPQNQDIAQAYVHAQQALISTNQAILADLVAHCHLACLPLTNWRSILQWNVPELGLELVH